jgi:hypothetical protein
MPAARRAHTQITAQIHQPPIRHDGGTETAAAAAAAAAATITLCAADSHGGGRSSGSGAGFPRYVRMCRWIKKKMPATTIPHTPSPHLSLMCVRVNACIRAVLRPVVMMLDSFHRFCDSDIAAPPSVYVGGGVHDLKPLVGAPSEPHKRAKKGTIGIQNIYTYAYAHTYTHVKLEEGERR